MLSETNKLHQAVFLWAAQACAYQIISAAKICVHLTSWNSDEYSAFRTARASFHCSYSNTAFWTLSFHVVLLNDLITDHGDIRFFRGIIPDWHCLSFWHHLLWLHWNHIYFLIPIFLISMYAIRPKECGHVIIFYRNI